MLRRRSVRTLRFEPLEPRQLLAGGEIRGTVWNDVNRDGIKAFDESVLTGWNVFLDLNQNGNWDTGEFRQATDASGNFAFTNLAPGQYVVATDLPSGAKQTYPATSATPLYSRSNPTCSGFDDFGTVLAADGNRLLVGAGFDDTEGTNTGRAYLYDGTNGTLLRTIRNPYPLGNDNFGSALALSGNTLFIGAFRDDHFASDSGAVFQFDASTEPPIRTRTFPGPTEAAPAAGDLFGHTLALQGDKLAISAPQYNRGIGGYVKIYNLASGDVRTIANPDRNPNDIFGYALAWVGDKLARHAANSIGSGKVYLFNPDTGILLATFINPSPNAGDAFGGRLAAAGNDLVVSAFADDTDGLDNGLVYVFNTSTGEYRVIHNTTAAGVGGYFGVELLTHGSHILAGSLRDDRGAADSGAAFLFEATTGELLQTYVNPYPAYDDEFGGGLAFVGNRVAIGRGLATTAPEDSTSSPAQAPASVPECIRSR